jgi:WD40 repeat protein
LFDQWTNNILIGSRKINAWNFHTQEEIKTSHEHPVAFCLNNIEKFESVVSADDNGSVVVWDIENGKKLFYFSDTHGSREKGKEGSSKITAGCFDSYQRRLVTAGKDGTVKMWNFSNGSKLKDMISTETGKKIDREVTSLVCCVSDPEDSDALRDSQIVSVGWNRRIHVWDVDEEEDLESKHIFPSKDKKINGHTDDIMSAVYDRKNHYIYTGGHNG